MEWWLVGSKASEMLFGTDVICQTVWYGCGSEILLCIYRVDEYCLCLICLRDMDRSCHVSVVGVGELIQEHAWMV